MFSKTVIGQPVFSFSFVCDASHLLGYDYIII